MFFLNVSNVYRTTRRHMPERSNILSPTVRTSNLRTRKISQPQDLNRGILTIACVGVCLPALQSSSAVRRLY